MENLNNEIGNEIETFTIKVDSELSEAELLELADEIVAYDKNIQVSEADLDELKKQVSELKKNIAEMENIRRMMMLDYERKRKSLNYTCTKNINYDNGTVEYVDIYSNEIVKTEPFDENDMFATTQQGDDAEELKILVMPSISAITNNGKEDFDGIVSDYIKINEAIDNAEVVLN